MNKSRELNKQMKNPKILVIFNSWALVPGGTGMHIIEVTNYWDEHSEVHLLIPKLGFDIAKQFIKKNLNSDKEMIIYRTPFETKKIAGNRFLVRLLQLFRVIKTILLIPKLENNYDIVVSTSHLPYDSIPAVLLKLMIRKVKICSYFHEILPTLKGKNFFHRLLSVIAWRFSIFLGKTFFDLIFVVNDSVRNYFIKKGLNPQKVILTSNGIYYNEILNINHEKKEYEGVFVGQLIQRKGVPDLVKAWKIVVMKHPFAKFCIIGDGPERKKIEEKIKEEGLVKNITLVGRVEEEEKYKLMKKSKVFIFPSYQEGWGIVIAEAMACGLPVVAYDLPVYREIFDDYISTVEVGNYRQMAEKIVDTIETYQDYEKTAKEARNFVSKYSWKRVAEHELSHIEKIIYEKLRK